MQEIIIAVMVAVTANLLTPAIRAGIGKLLTSAAIKMQSSSIRIAEIKLKQLEDEKESIEKLANKPLELANRIAYIATLQIMILWVIVLIVVVVVFSSDGILYLNSTWTGGVFGIIGYAATFPIGFAFSMRNLEKVNNLERFKQKNTLAQNKVIEHIEKLKRANNANPAVGKKRRR